MNSEKVSIICSVYNGEKFIRDTLESCYSQSYKNIEIIIIDDYSSDESSNIIKKFIENKENVKFIKNKENIGFIRSINKAVKYSTGEWILIIGHDDILPKEHIELMSTNFNEEVSFIHCNSNVIDAKGNYIKLARVDKKQIKKTKETLFYLAIDNFISSTGLIINKNKFVKVGGFNEKYKNYGEWMLWINLAKIGTVKYNTNTKAKYRKHLTNISNTFISRNINDELNRYKQESKELAYKELKLSKFKKIKLKSYLNFNVIKNKLRMLIK